MTPTNNARKLNARQLIANANNTLKKAKAKTVDDIEKLLVRYDDLRLNLVNNTLAQAVHDKMLPITRLHLHKRKSFNPQVKKRY